MAAKLSLEEEEFLAKCEEEFKDRYTEKDEEFMKVFNKAPSIPPIMERFWQGSSNYGHRYNRRNNRYRPYEQHGHRDNQDSYDRGPRGYNNHNNYNRPRY